MGSRLIFIFVLSLTCSAYLQSQVSLVSSVSSACDTLVGRIVIEPVEVYDTTSSVNWIINDDIHAGTEDSLLIKLDSSGSYSVRALINGQYELSLDNDLQVFSTPESDFTFSDTTSTDDLTYVFRSMPQSIDTLNYSYHWLINNEDAGSLPDIVHSFNETGNFSVQLIVDNNKGCVNSSIKTIVVEELLKIPNVFTPNMDGHNDFFSVKTDGNTVYDFRVFSRSGLKVYHTKSPAIHWDGRSLSGIEMQTGIYYYTIESLNTGEPAEISGFVHLIR